MTECWKFLGINELCVRPSGITSLITDQVANAQQLFKLLSHWVMLHGHEDGVEDDADGDGKIDKWIHDDGVQQFFQPPPTTTAVPLQEDVSKRIPAWRTRPLVLLKVWNKKVNFVRKSIVLLFKQI